MPLYLRKICDYCGSETDVDTDKCPNCSSAKFTPVPVESKLSQLTASSRTVTTSSESSKPARNGKKRKLGVFIFAVIIGIISIVVPTMKKSHVVTDSATFIEYAEAAGYFMIIEDDYDSFHTYWAGAHKFLPLVNKVEGNEEYVIDYTRDANITNAKVEYNIYVDNVINIGGISRTGGSDSSNIQYQINSNSLKFGIAYRNGQVNYYVVAPAQYKAEIIAFFALLGIDAKI